MSSYRLANYADGIILDQANNRPILSISKMKEEDIEKQYDSIERNKDIFQDMIEAMHTACEVYETMTWQEIGNMLNKEFGI